MSDYKDVLSAWKSIGKTASGKVVVEDLTEQILNHSFNGGDPIDTGIEIGEHNGMVDILGLLNGGRNE